MHALYVTGLAPTNPDMANPIILMKEIGKLEKSL
jgi:hypothetical protein